jgi:hypothetical protein
VRREEKTLREMRPSGEAAQKGAQGAFGACGLGADDGSRGLHARKATRVYGDAFRLCSAEIPNVDRVRACLHRNAGGSSAPGHTGRGRAAAERQAGNCACMAQSPFISAQSTALGHNVLPPKPQTCSVEPQL